MVEQEAVNFEVAGSSPAPGAILDESPIFLLLAIYSKYLPSVRREICIYCLFHFASTASIAFFAL